MSMRGTLSGQRTHKTYAFQRAMQETIGASDVHTTAGHSRKELGQVHSRLA